jgi:predicted PurR-regulated permease PerM
MDRSVSAFIRGRLIQSFVIAVVLTTGWGLAGVPYFLLLGIAGGILNLIPYAAITTWPLAVTLAWIDRASGGGGGGGGFSFWMVLFWPSIVYVIAQSLDGWVIEPLVQGKATELDPLAILLAVLTGGTLLGLFGMMLAIPTAACLKILMQEVILPRVRTWAEKH